MSSNLSQILPIVSLGLLSVICMVCGKDRLITASTKSLWILFVCLFLHRNCHEIVSLFFPLLCSERKDSFQL